jgi:hypothetical protein
VGGVSSLAIQRDLALTMPNYKAGPVSNSHGHTWITPDKKKKKKKSVLSTSNQSGGAVDLYSYPSGTAMGSITGLSSPYGQCVDAKGDVYVAEFSNGSAVEYAHGKTTAIHTYTPGGEPIGCSVDAAGDVAVTSFSPGSVTVYAGGDPTKGTQYTDSSCSYQWPMGYDNKGNLIGVGETSGITVCALLAKATSEVVLTTSGITIDFPGATMWDGKYIALGDQEAGATFHAGLWPATLSGTTLTGTTETTLTDTCSSSYDDTVEAFVVGTKNTPVNTVQGKTVVGGNLDCSNEFDIWAYPAGGNPSGHITVSAIMYGQAVSIGK